ncbi:MAG TPA: DUF4388 domain-containing protein [Desulfobacterales bacterium]|nr:DUF4388 domain-containing protein [Desulfobacterales bacterium]
MVTLKIMKSFELFFKIIADNNCPLYERGELLTLSDKALSCPENKPTCLILVREMTNILFSLLDSGPVQDGGEKKVYSCSGCTGLIKFDHISEQEARLDGLIASDSPLDPEGEAMLKVIRDFPLIKVIPKSDIPRTLRCFRKERLPADTTFITKGQNSLYLYLILSGKVVVSDSAMVIATLGKGDICGEMSYLGGGTAGADVRTLEESEVLSISGEAFSKLLDTIPELQLFMSKLLVQRLTESNASHFDTFDACMSGWIAEMPPAELFQIFHMNQKTGVLSLELPKGGAKVSFREGCVINAHYGQATNQTAIFDMLQEKEGRYKFTTGLTPEEMKAVEIGDFMMLLMEGIKRVDESGEDS